MFQRCKSQEDVKKIYKKLCMFLHPDKGGEHDLMVLLTEHYEMTLQIVSAVQDVKQDKKKPLYEKAFEDIHEGDERIEIIESILKYAKAYPNFSLLYTYSVSDYLENKGYITSAQYNTLVKFYYAFHMHEEPEDE